MQFKFSLCIYSRIFKNKKNRFRWCQMNSKEKWITFLLLLSTFIGISNVMIIAPLLKLFKLSIGIKESQYGVVLGAYPILSFITSVIIGPISDKHGRRALLIIGLTHSIIDHWKMANWISQLKNWNWNSFHVSSLTRMQPLTRSYVKIFISPPSTPGGSSA